MQTRTATLHWHDYEDIQVRYALADTAHELPPVGLGKLFNEALEVDLPMGFVVSLGADIDVLSRLWDQELVTSTFRTLAETNDLINREVPNPQTAFQLVLQMIQREFLSSILGAKAKGSIGMFVLSRSTASDGSVRLYPRTGLIQGRGNWTVSEVVAYGNLQDRPYTEAVNAGRRENHIRNMHHSSGIVNWNRAAFIGRPGRSGIQVLGKALKDVLTIPPRQRTMEEKFAEVDAAVKRQYRSAVTLGVVTTQIIAKSGNEG